jgi:CRP/FNR family cyclic AMP-dependent transcriptional regulator
VRTRQQCELAEMTYPRFRQIAAESPGLVFELATQLATRLGIVRVVASDAIREVMRALFSHELMPTLHASSQRQSRGS